MYSNCDRRDVRNAIESMFMLICYPDSLYWDVVFVYVVLSRRMLIQILNYYGVLIILLLLSFE